jgi:hypothetical protein
MAEIPVQPKRDGGAELPVQPKRRNIWPWVVALLILVLLPFLFLRRDRGNDTAAVPDTGALVDTTSRFGGGRATGTAAGAVAADTGVAGARTGTRATRTERSDTTTRTDSATRRDTTRRGTDTNARR